MTTPSDSELDVLKAFWRRGEMSAAEAHAEVAAESGWALSTTRTLIERMRAKGLLSRRSVHGVAVYAPARSKVDVIGGVLNRLRDALDLEGPLPVAAFSGSQILSEQELAELEARLNGPDAAGSADAEDAQ